MAQTVLIVIFFLKAQQSGRDTKLCSKVLLSQKFGHICSMGTLPPTALMRNHEKIVPLKTFFTCVFWWLLELLRFIVTHEQLCHEMQCLNVLKELSYVR